MGSEDPHEGLLLRLAQFGELLRDVRDRAVVLADLHAGADAAVEAAKPEAVNAPAISSATLSTSSTFSSAGAMVPRIESTRRRAKSSTAASPPSSRRCRIAAVARSS